MSAACPTFGFHVAFALEDALAPTTRDATWNAWAALLAGRGLEGRSGDDERRFRGVVTSVAAQATDGDRVAIAAWLSARPELAEWRVGELVELQTS
jgi:uncharacterized protein YggL (DUF469 family)